MRPKFRFGLSGLIFRYVMGLYHAFDSGIRSLRSSIPYLTSIRSGDLRKEVTEQYPDPVSSRIADELPARTRGLLKNDITKCTGCGDCVLACPTRAISLVAEEAAIPGKKWVSSYVIDFSTCIACGFCVEVCQPQSLKHTREFELAGTDRESLKIDFGKGNVSAEERRRWEMLRNR